MNKLEKIAKLYDDRVRNLGYSAQSVGWKSERQQDLRFEILVSNQNVSNSIVLDIGCGFGDFLKFLYSQNISPLKYIGIDISDEVLKIAEKIHSDAENVIFLKRDLMAGGNELVDFAVASGSLNYRLQTDMNSYLDSFIQLYEPRVKCGLLLNFLSTKVDFMQNQHAHYSPEYVKNLFKKYFRHVTLIEDYGLYEFTIQALK